MLDVVRNAQAAGTAVAAFNVVLLEHAEAIVEGAERAGRPVILQISENCILYHGSLEPLTLACIALANRASVEVFVHLDHITDPALVPEGIRLGVDSVMFDASSQPYSENVAKTKDVAALCHDSGVLVEAELGEIGGKGGAHASGARTDPDEAAEFVSLTGVDTLAVAVGTTHAMATREAHVDRELIERIRASTSVPLVLHGSSGLSDAELTSATAAGIAKVNISTHLNALFTTAVRRELERHPDVTDPRKYITAGRSAVAEEARRLLLILAPL